MSLFRLILLSVRHFWKMNVAVACGVAVGTTVLTGALLVGDSMHGSLRDLVPDGLGRIDEVLVADLFFREELADDGTKEAATSAPVIFYSGSLETVDPAPPARVDQVNLVGCDERFWRLGNGPAPERIERDEMILNEPLARLLAVKEDDSVILGLRKTDGIPAESAFGRKRVSVDTMRLKVVKIIPAEGLGRFALRPNQRVPLNAYLSLVALQSQLQEPGRVNAILRETPPPGSPWHLPLADYGIHIEPSPQGYVDITTDRMIFQPDIEKALLRQLRGLDVQPTLTYLANTIACGKLEVPYSTVTAIDFQDDPPFGPFISTEGSPVPKLEDNQIALNTRAAQRLKARVGDSIRVTFFEPESNFGLLQERTVELKLAAIVKLEGAAADKNLTPTVRGLTDKRTIEDWDLPFEIQRGRIKPDDDRYWTKYAATPKAFVSLATGRRLWASRFGQTTALRIRPVPGITAETETKTLAKLLDLDPVEQGYVFRPIKEQALKAVSGSTRFGVLFLAFSFFVIAAAVMLVMLLFRLGIEQRAKHVGLLLAPGFRPRQVTRLLAGEGLCVALAGSLIGTLAGVGYAALMLFGLRTWWLPAIGTPFLTLHVTWQSMVIGFSSGLLLALAAMWLAVRRMGRIAPLRLLAGGRGESEVDIQADFPYAGAILKPGASVMSTGRDFHLRPKQNPLVGVVLKWIAVVVGFATFAAVVVLLVVGVTTATPFLANSDWFNLLRYVFFFAIGLILLITAKAFAYFNRWGRRHLTRLADDVLAKDRRPPILYLRSFAADDSVHFEEEVFAEILNGFGPVVAIGRPGEHLPPLGASRFYVAHADWQTFVTKLLEKSAMVVVLAGSTPGLSWELRECRAKVDPKRLLVLVPRDRREFDAFRAAVEVVTDLRFPEFPSPPADERYASRWLGFLMFDADWRSSYVPLSIPKGKEYLGYEAFGKEYATRAKLRNSLRPAAIALGFPSAPLPPHPGWKSIGRSRFFNRVAIVAFVIWIIVMVLKCIH